MGNTSSKGPVSIAMLVYRSVILKVEEKSSCIWDRKNIILHAPTQWATLLQQKGRLIIPRIHPREFLPVDIRPIYVFKASATLSAREGLLHFFQVWKYIWTRFGAIIAHSGSFVTSFFSDKNIHCTWHGFSLCLARANNHTDSRQMMQLSDTYKLHGRWVIPSQPLNESLKWDQGAEILEWDSYLKVPWK